MRIKTMSSIIQHRLKEYKKLALFVTAFAVLGTIALIASHAASTSVITGAMWQDTNKNGLFDAGEIPFANQQVNLFDGVTGAYIVNVKTDANGNYRFDYLSDGQYKVQLDTATWWNLDHDWMPTTGNTLDHYSKIVALNGVATAQIGLRQIVKSTDVNAPISSFTAPSGLVIKSYVDAVSAQDIYADFSKGSLVGGAESSHVTIQFGLGSGSSTAAGSIQSNGLYTDYNANSAVSFDSWLNPSFDNTLFHEYGHAWSLYNAYVTQQDPSLTQYQKVRGIFGDARINTSYAWDVKEMIAEDYRELFGTVTAVPDGAQINHDVPLAKDVPGLKEYLMGTFIQRDTTIPTAPSSLAGVGLSQTQIKLTWNASSDNIGVTGYDIYRGGVVVGSTSGTVTSYTDSGLTAGAPYSYFVKAKDGSGNVGPASNTISVSTQSAPPVAPSGLTSTTIKDTTVTLSWSASPSTTTTNYDIYRNTQKVGTVNTPSLTFADTGLTPLTAYTYYVVARDAAGAVSPASNSLTIKTQAADTQAPTKPANLKAVSTTKTSVSLSWTASSDNFGVTEYRIYKVGSSSPLASVTGTSGTVAGLNANTPYSFYVSAVDLAGNVSSPSNTVKVRTSR